VGGWYTNEPVYRVDHLPWQLLMTVRTPGRMAWKPRGIVIERERERV
jgi:hypothetical protein